jgi:hypothetical protein
MRQSQRKKYAQASAAAVGAKGHEAQRLHARPGNAFHGGRLSRDLIGQRLSRFLRVPLEERPAGIACWSGRGNLLRVLSTAFLATRAL